MTDASLPLHGSGGAQLDPEPPEALAALAEALATPVADRTATGRLLQELAAAHPAFLDGWAHLAAWALDSGDPVAAYAYARTGYHRGLDRARKAGWRGQGALPWSAPANRGFLRSVHALLRAAAAIGEHDEAQRCRAFLLELDPDDHLDVRGLDPDSLSR